MVVLDLARPWNIKNSFDQWVNVLEGQLLQQYQQLPTDAENALYKSIRDYLLAYEDPVCCYDCSFMRSCLNAVWYL